MSTLHEQARAWAAAGFYIFPCAPNAKTPAIGNGHLKATTDLALIDAWWGDNPNFNIGVVPDRSGLWVLDVDPPLGAETLASLEAKHGACPSTLMIRTPRGGLHYWFEGSVASTVGKLGPKLDTRGRGGYVLVPPSIVNGVHYEQINDADIVAGPEWVEIAIDAGKESVGAGDDRCDLPSSVARAEALLRQYVQADDVAVEGEGGDDRTYRLCAEILNLGLSPGVARDLIARIWNPSCRPEWTLEELETKIINALNYAQNEVGAWATPPAEETFGSLAATLKSQIPPPSRFYPRDEQEQDSLADPTWLLPDLIPDDAIVMMYGPSGGYKSFLALDIALTVASGVKAYGRSMQAPCDVVYAAAEGARSIVRKRRPAWRLAHGITQRIPFFAVDAVPLVARPEEVIHLIEAIKERNLRPKLVVIDTLARALAGLNENDAKDAGVFIEAIECIKRAFNCAVLVVHHTGKEEARGARGSSALFAGFDAVIEVKATKQTKCIELVVRKQKDADERETPLYFQGNQIQNSLVFTEINRSDYDKATSEGNLFSRDAIGQALRALGAIGADDGVTRRALAAQLTIHDASDASTAGAEKMLKKLATTSLEAYVWPNGMWALPLDQLG